jgi:KaiC/GvpD/RAD55 family RecA-like ATPase
MSTQIASVFVPRPIATPRGAEWASGLAISLAQIAHKVWAALEATGYARARRELDRSAASHSYDTGPGQALRCAMYLNRGNRG